jgi:hypothetical protein
VIDFLIRTSVVAHTIIRKAMGKGNGIDESHCMKKRPARRLASD